MNWKQGVALASGALWSLVILEWSGSWPVGEVVRRMPVGADAVAVMASISCTLAARVLLALVLLGTVIAMIRLRNRAA